MAWRRPCASGSTAGRGASRWRRSGGACVASTDTCRTRRRGSSRRTSRRPTGSRARSTDWPRGSAWCRSSCTRSCPPQPRSCSPRWVARTARSKGRDSAPGRGAPRWANSASSSPRWSHPRPTRPEPARVVVDTHCHLDACESPVAELVGHARDAGVRKLATVGTDGASIGRALEAAAEHDEVYAIVGRHPHEAGGFDQAGAAEIERAAGDPRAVAIGETGLDYYRDLAPRDEQRRAFEAQLELAAG